MKATTLICLIMVLAVALTTGAVSQTFAKYIDTSYGLDSVKLATFDIKINGENDLSVLKIEDMFQQQYRQIKVGQTTYYAISSQNQDNVVAPGTSGGFDLNISGKSHVMVDITMGLDFKWHGRWQIEENGQIVEYYPIVWLINGKVADSEGYKKGSIEALKNQLSSMNARVEPNKAIEDSLGEVRIDWVWAMDGSQMVGEGVRVDTLNGQTNERDTALANIFQDFLGRMEITITVKAEQVTEID